MITPAVSVIIPCYNPGEFLGDAVESVLKQTFQDFEILIVDDGSTDPSTQKLLDDFQRPRTTIVRTSNGGRAAAKNLALARTSGRYVCTVDPDDRLEPTLLQKSVEALELDAAVSFVSHWLKASGDGKDWTPTTCALPALLDVNTVSGAALVRRSAIESVAGFDETFRDGYDDWDLWISLVEQGHKGAIIHEALCRRRAPSHGFGHGDQYSGPYRQLVDKHLASYRTHLAALLLRREEDFCIQRNQVHDFELQQQRGDIELTRRRDDAASLRRKAERQARERTVEDEVARLRASVARAELEAAQARVELVSATDRAEQQQRALLHALTPAAAAGQPAASAEPVASAGAGSNHVRQEELIALCMRLRAQLEASEKALEAAGSREMQLDRVARQAKRELIELRESISWRLTAPLRTLFGGEEPPREPDDARK